MTKATAGPSLSFFFLSMIKKTKRIQKSKANIHPSVAPALLGKPLSQSGVNSIPLLQRLPARAGLL